MIRDLFSESGHRIFYSQNEHVETVIAVQFHGVSHTIAASKHEIAMMFACLEVDGHYVLDDDGVQLEVKKYGTVKALLRIVPAGKPMTIEDDPETLVFFVERLKQALFSV